MTGWIPLALAASLNLWIAIGQGVDKNYPLALVFLCYAVSSMAFIWSIYR